MDWVFIELRDIQNNVLETRSALVRRDGSVVDANGNSSIEFRNLASSNVMVAVRHRNHLGAITTNTIQMNSGLTSTVDFTSSSADVIVNSMRTFTNNKKALWSGNGNDDGQVVYQGSGSDIQPITNAVFSDPVNANFELSFPVLGYNIADYNMDGKVVYQGFGSDILPLTQSVFSNPLNASFQLTFPVAEQIP